VGRVAAPLSARHAGCPPRQLVLEADEWCSHYFNACLPACLPCLQRLTIAVELVANPSVVFME
jgi:hypothetical protein